MNNNRNKASDKHTNITLDEFINTTLHGDKDKFIQMMADLPTHKLHAYLYDARMISAGKTPFEAAFDCSNLLMDLWSVNPSDNFLKNNINNVGELIKQLDPFVLAELSTNVWGGLCNRT